jgi:release factor glutamine methyltransferase
MLSLLEIITKTTDFFAGRGIESPRLNAEQVIGHALGLKRMQLYVQFERLLTEAELEKIRPLVKRRAQREPLQHIVGNVEWGGLTLKCDKRALIPRPETEELLELILERAKPAATTLDAPGTPSAPTRVLDLGTGSGALALALAKAWPFAAVTALDASDDALALARENAAANGLAERVVFLKSDWFSALPAAAAPFDVIVSNPPYLTDAEVAAAEPEVRLHDPLSALVAPEAGLADLKKIIAGSAPRLVPGGLLALETGVGQHAALLAALAAAGLRDSESRADLRGRERFVLARR